MANRKRGQYGSVDVYAPLREKLCGKEKSTGKKLCDFLPGQNGKCSAPCGRKKRDNPQLLTLAELRLIRKEYGLSKEELIELIPM